MSGKHNGCSSCGGCANKIKPSDCMSNGCGRCCGNSCKKVDSNSFLMLLRERQFLPFIHVGEQIIFKENEWVTEQEQDVNASEIRKYEQLNYLTLDWEDSLDEYSYSDYNKELLYLEEQGKIHGKGTIAITQHCIDSFK